MTTQEIAIKFNKQKIHNARTKRALKNLDDNERLFKRFGGLYTQAEINLHYDIHPCSRAQGEVA